MENSIQVSILDKLLFFDQFFHGSYRRVENARNLFLRGKCVYGPTTLNPGDSVVASSIILSDLIIDAKILSLLMKFVPYNPVTFTTVSSNKIIL